MIGRGIDSQLSIEAMDGYSAASRKEVPERLQSFYDKTDRSRHGKHDTEL